MYLPRYRIVLVQRGAVRASKLTLMLGVDRLVAEVAASHVVQEPVASRKGMEAGEVSQTVG